MMEKRFKIFRHLLKTKSWDFAMIVEIAPDRLHHGFWKFHDPQHPKHEPSNPYLNCIRDFYQAMDRELGLTIQTAGNDTTILLVSDHGVKRMDGGFCVNEWLVREGYLALQEAPNRVVPFSQAKVYWSKTKAWSEGEYYVRVFLNVNGRGPQGSILSNDYEKV